MHSAMNRRHLLKTGAAVTIVAGSQLFTGIPALADYAAGPALRRNASNMAANDPILRGYRRAIQAMRALPDTNPCSWFYQAAIHGTHDPRNLQSWNTCHLDPDFFWAWHRMYLYWFERIVRKHSGMYDWAIPYWDWTNPAQRALPAPFRDSASLLYDATRNPGINAGTSQLSTGLATSVNGAMTWLDYFDAQGSVDGPHGSVHIAVSGNMSTFEGAAQDPIFWVHHAQVDRLWNLWLAQGGGRSNPVSVQSWRNASYTFFDECCQPVTMTGCQVLRAANQLSYAYEGEPTQVNQYCPRVIPPWIRDVAVLAQWPIRLQLGPGPMRTQLVPREAANAGPRLREILARGRQVVGLELRNVEAETQPGVSWEVHVGRQGFTPGPRTLVGTFALFGSGVKDRRRHYHPGRFLFSISRALRGLDPASLEVAFVPVSGRDEGRRAEPARPRAPVTIGELALILDAPMPQPPRDEQERLRREEQAQ